MASARMRAVPDPSPDTEEPAPVDAAPEPEPEVTEGEILEEPAAAPVDGTTEQLLRSIYATAHQAQIHAAETRADVAIIRKTVAGGVFILLALMFLASFGRKKAPAA